MQYYRQYFHWSRCMRCLIVWVSSSIHWPEYSRRRNFRVSGWDCAHVWTIKGYFETIDSSLEEAAALDGATPWQAFRLVLLPLSVPILAVVFILSFIAAITEVPVASLLLRDVNSFTLLAVGMQQYLNPQNYLWGDFAAAAVMSALPITIVFLLAQRWLVNGLTAGGVKG